MKKNVFFRQRLLSAAEVLLLAAMMAAPFTVSAQVTIGSGDLPQATLDVVGTYPTNADKGKAFRLDDGNQAPGKVLTCGENAIGTWESLAISIKRQVSDYSRPAPIFAFSDYSSTNRIIYVDEDYIDLAPGQYLIFIQMPVTFNFPVGVMETVRFRISLIKDGSSVLSPIQTVAGPLAANTMIRNIQMAYFDNSQEASVTRYYIGYWTFDLLDANYHTISPQADMTVKILGDDVGGNVFAIPVALE